MNRSFFLKNALVGSVILLPFGAHAQECEPSRWTVTLEMLEPLTVEERQTVLNVLGIEMDPDILDQAIAESQVPLEVFGGE